MAVQPIPDGFHTITPYLMVEGAAEFIDFLKQAFNAEEKNRTTLPDGLIMHAQVRIGNSMLMLSDARGEWKAMPAMIFLYVENADEVYARALQAGATSLREMTDEFYGDRMGGVTDRFGNQWWISTHVEDVSPEEMKRREEEVMRQRAEATA